MNTTQHVIVGRYGLDDQSEVYLADGEQCTVLQLIPTARKITFGIGDALTQMAKLGVFTSEIGVDLLVLAAHVYAADTRISRSSESQDQWTRKFRIVAPVSDTVKWTAATETLERMLNFLTGDIWKVSFRVRPQSFQELVPAHPRGTEPARYTDVSLFSGGLDSLIGAIDLLNAGRGPLLVSHAGEGATGHAQRVLFEKLKSEYDESLVDRLRLWMAYPSKLVQGIGSEETTRGRSFLFFSAGVVACEGIDTVSVLRVPENGLIALNVPLDPLRLGALSTRTTHPFYMARWNDLLDTLGIRCRVENPYWSTTKGEMVANCANRALLSHLIPESISCSSASKARWLRLPTQHCGYCLPCIIRRAAIRSGMSGLPDPTKYTLTDFVDHNLNSRQAEGQHVRSFQYAIERIQKRPELATYLINKPGPLSDESPDRRLALADVYRRGLAEVAGLLDGVRTAPG